MAWKDCLQGKEMRNIHSQKKGKERGERAGNRWREREWEEDQRGEKWQKIQDRVMEE